MDKEKILINLSPLKSGGGQNVGKNLLEGLLKYNDENIELFFYASKGSDLATLVETNFKKYLLGPQNPIIRSFYERIFLTNYCKKNRIRKVYSCFGYVFVNRCIKQISGVAVSNLLFPEIDFWSDYSGIKKIYRKIIDYFRMKGYKKSDALIFENKAMYERSHIIFGGQISAKYIKPSMYICYDNKEFVFEKSFNNSKVGLFLCGWQLNKNIMIIPKLVKRLKELDYNLEIIITVDENDSNSVSKRFISTVGEYGVEDYVHLVGKVEKEQLFSLYEKTDFVFLLSRLESFSNNIIEAWCYGKPLIVSDEEWAHSICKRAALYVQRDNVEDIAYKIQNVMTAEYIAEVVALGKKEYKTYPSVKERTEMEINYVKSI